MQNNHHTRCMRCMLLLILFWYAVAAAAVFLSSPSSAFLLLSSPLLSSIFSSSLSVRLRLKNQNGNLYSERPKLLKINISMLLSKFHSKSFKKKIYKETLKLSVLKKSDKISGAGCIKITLNYCFSMIK